MQEVNLGLNKPIRVAIVTNIPAPYRIPIYKILAQHWGLENFKVFYCAEKEGNRDWQLEQSGFKFKILKPCVFEYAGRYIHYNFDIVKALKLFQADVVITTGFNPTFIFAFAYAMANKKIHICMTDGTLASEQTLTFIHEAIRRSIFKYSKAFIGASVGSFKLYQSYGINKERIFKSHLCANNLAFHEPLKTTQRHYDLMFSGRFAPEKNPLFAIEVAAGVAKLLNRKITLLMLGSGPFLEQAKHYATGIADIVEVIFPGFVQQDELPEYYCSAKVFLFPSSWDPWGVVANEACAAGQAVLISPHAGAANDLVINNENGYVMDLELSLWVEKAATLLSNPNLLTQLSKKSISMVQTYNYDSAALGIINAVDSATEVFNKPLRVVIVQRRLTHYRVLFFELLREKLASQNIQLELCVGKATVKEQSKRDEGSLAWAKSVPTLYFLNDRLCLQFFTRYLSGADLVVITQENGLLSNLLLLLLLLLPLRKFKLAFWGHGANLQSKAPKGFKERFKKWTTKRVDWWFAYTQLSHDLITKEDFNADYITVLNNAIDTTHLKQLALTVTALDIQKLRESLGLGDGKVGVYIGSFYVDKRLDFLFAAAERIYDELPDFHLLLIGDGPERHKVQAFCATHPWALWVGSKVEQDKVNHLALAQLMLNPGLVGLNILDSFSCGLPMLTTDCGIHSPEISYLQNDVNGVMTADDINIYSQKALELFQNPLQIERLREGCYASANEYTLENMVSNFAEGVLKCLDSGQVRL